jgi:hypothetical protein
MYPIVKVLKIFPIGLKVISVWIEDVEINYPENSIKILFGNKCDSLYKEVTYGEGKKLADS